VPPGEFLGFFSSHLENGGEAALLGASRACTTVARKSGTILLPVLAPTWYPIRRATDFKLSVLKNTSRSRPSISAAARNAPSDAAGFASPGAEGPQASRNRLRACKQVTWIQTTERREKKIEMNQR